MLKNPNSLEKLGNFMEKRKKIKPFSLKLYYGVWMFNKKFRKLRKIKKKVKVCKYVDMCVFNIFKVFI